MAFTGTGFTGTVNELQWAQFMELAMGGNAAQIVQSGLACATGGITRIVTVGTGSLAAAGVVATNSSSVSVTHNANGSANNRLDIVVAEVNWSADTVTATKVTGTTGSATPVLPSLTQTAGVTWQVPLAVVTVRPGVTSIAAADIEDVRPFRPSMVVYRPAVTLTTVGASASPKTIALQTIPDPGWPYRISVGGGVEFAGTTAGRGEIAVLVDSVQVTSGRAPSQNTGPAMIRPETTGVKTGSHTVTLTMQALNMSVALESQSPSSLTIEVIPA